MKIYNVGMYIRLSREDEKLGESESISNQRNIILDYIKKLGFNLVDEYIDDGYSGTNFNRPGFLKLIKDIESGKINTVITKDYSRLGRDYIESGRYIEKYFPEHNVRYIAILDNIDTFLDNNDMAPFRAVFNDQYAKDISKKVRSSIESKKKQGKFLGWKAPFGYIKDPNDKYKLIIDAKASKVVKRIFSLAYNNYSDKQIADILSEEKVLIPSIYANLNRSNKSTAYGLWCSRTISDILTNEVYIGNLVQGKRKKINYKLNKEIKTSSENWIVQENAHEPIIEKELFYKVLNMRNKNKNKRYDSKIHLLSGFLYCDECGHKIGIIKASNSNKYYLSCTYYRKYSKFNLCTPHTMSYEKLELLVLNEIKKIFKMCENKNDLIHKLDEDLETLKIKKEINSKDLELNNLLKDKEKIYFDKLNEIITLDEYKKYINVIMNKYKLLLEEKKILLDQFEKIKINFNKDKVVDDYLDCQNINRHILSGIIDKIMVTNNKEVKIFYKIKSPFIIDICQ